MSKNSGGSVDKPREEVLAERIARKIREAKTKRCRNDPEYYFSLLTDEDAKVIKVMVLCDWNIGKIEIEIFARTGILNRQGAYAVYLMLKDWQQEKYGYRKAYGLFASLNSIEKKRIWELALGDKQNSYRNVFRELQRMTDCKSDVMIMQATQLTLDILGIKKSLS